MVGQSSHTTERKNGGKIDFSEKDEKNGVLIRRKWNVQEEMGKKETVGSKKTQEIILNEKWGRNCYDNCHE
jgi:hypothetical protein